MKQNKNAVRQFVLDRILEIDETDCQLRAMIHDADNEKNQFCVSAWTNNVPDLSVGAVIEGILSIELVLKPRRCDSPLTHEQEGIQIHAVVEVVRTLNRDGDVLVRTDADDITAVVVFEQKETFAETDRIYVEGELWLQDPEHIHDLEEP